ncbi:MAG TPA: DUF932 domain-containing protein [Verrucomicrobiae bacterium]|nr:DUF932 domain-containing protein [Verrucomicrobiae bacterium]
MMPSRYSSTNLRPLDDAALHAAAPSVFASAAWNGVSDKYSFLPTSEVVARMRENQWLPVWAKEQTVRLDSRRGFQKHIIRFQRADQIGIQSEYRPEICLVNSHDRSSAYQIHAGIFRLICGNGLIIADTTFEHVSVRHVGFHPDKVIEASFRVLENVPRLADSVEGFRARRLTPIEQKAFAESAILLKYDDLQKAPIRAEKVLESRRHDDNGDDLWKTYNRVQENLIRGGLKDWGRRKENGSSHPRTRPVKGIDENVKLNKALWHLAEALKNGGLPASSSN